MHYEYITKGVCARMISFDINDGILSNVVFVSGCPGNLKAISKLIEGKNALEIATTLAGNTCGWKPTSCTDQLSIAIMEALKNQ